MATKTKTQKEAYYQCRKCGDDIYWNTHKKMIACKCGVLEVDGCEDYVRLIGDRKDWRRILLLKK